MAEYVSTGLIPPSNILAATYTVATLPPAADNLRKYAWTSDLFGGPGDYVISDGMSWKPVRPLAVLKTSGNSNMTLTALLNAPTVILTGALSANRTVSLATTYAYAGAKFRVKREATGLFSLLVDTIGLGLNSWADMEYDGTGWVQTASGGLL